MDIVSFIESDSIIDNFLKKNKRKGLKRENITFTNIGTANFVSNVVNDALYIRN